MATKPLPARSPPAAATPPGLRPTRESEPEAPSQAAAYGRWMLRGLIMGALVVAGLKIVPPYLQAQAAKPKWEAAVNAFEAGKPQDALKLYQEAKSLAPSWDEVKGKYPEDAGKCYRAIGQQAEDEGKWVAAAANWKQMIEDVPDEAKGADAWYKAALALDRAGVREDAAVFAREAIAKAGGKHELAQKLVDRLGKKK